MPLPLQMAERGAILPRRNLRRAPRGANEDGRAMPLRVETNMRWLCAALLVLAGVGSAAASIRIDQSHYRNGTLTIVGRTGPDKTVILDGRYRTKSDADGDFRFAEHEKPFTCMSDIREGSSSYSAVISGCLDPGFDGNTLSIDQLPPISQPNAPLPAKKASAKPRK